MTSKVVKYLLLFHFFAKISTRTTDFCIFLCENKHTVCKRNPCGAAPHCLKYFQMLKITNEDRTFITGLHNDLRFSVAMKRNWFPPASNMCLMTYSEELEFVAQCWANNCQDKDDECRSITGIDFVGQNRFILHKVYTKISTREVLRMAMESWMHEESDVTLKTLKRFHYQSTGLQFTQLIWGKTEYLGCGITKFGNSINQKIIVICNYAPAGNELGYPVYYSGKLCGHCKRGTHKCLHGKYFPLCQRNMTDEEAWVAPFRIVNKSSHQIKNIFVILFTSGLGVISVFSETFLQ